MAAITAEKVKDFFRDLGIVVCDDSALIAAKMKLRRPYYVKLGKSPDPQRNVIAKDWMQLASKAPTRLPELLDLIYEDFRYSAKCSVVSSASKAVDPALIDILTDLAKRACLWEEPKLERPTSTSQMYADWVSKLKAPPPAGIALPPVGTDLVRKALVSDLRVDSAVGQVSLSWSLSGGNCDKVELVRVPQTAGHGGKKSQERRFSIPGQQTRFEDDSCEPGVMYEYQARAIFKGEDGDFCPPKVGCRFGKVTDFRARIAKGGVELSWKTPGANIPVCIFRRAGQNQSPQWLGQKNGLLEPQPGTDKLYYGNECEHSDTIVKEGTHYNYLIVANFDGQYVPTEPPVPVYIRKPPPDVPTAKAERDAKGVRVSWDAVSGGISVSYTVMRREGIDRASSILEDGCKRFDVEQGLVFLDSTVVTGKRYTYTVFARQDDLVSPKGRATQFVDVVAEVSNVMLGEGDGVVELHWDPPPNVDRIAVCRRINHMPKAHDDGTVIDVTGLNHAHDETVRNGMHYHYRVCCVFSPDGASEVITPGVIVQAHPAEFPTVVSDFRVEQEGAEGYCFWTPPECGRAEIRRTKDAPRHRYGERFSLDDSGLVGTAIPAGAAGNAVDAAPNVDEPFYTVYTVSGSHCIVGNTVECVVAPDVTRLEAEQTQSRAVLTWDWPEGCEAVVVARRADDWPTAHDDPEASRERYTRDQYNRTAERFVEVISQRSGTLHYVVYAEVGTAAGVSYAQGLSSGCRCALPWNSWMKIKYSLAPHPTGNHLVLEWTAENMLPDFSGFVLLADPSGVPSSPIDDMRLFDPDVNAIRPGETEHISLDPIRQAGWRRFFCKLAVKDPKQQRQVVITHPDTGVAFSASGAPQHPDVPAVPAKYEAGIPSEVVCPICWKPFHVEEMLFCLYGDIEKGDAKFVKREIPWHLRATRGIRKPVLKFPTDGSGRKLACKVCPNLSNGAHQLPVSAGNQRSLIIGLLGASRSSKTTYITALHRIIKQRVSKDFSVALNPSTDETSENIRRNDDLLFGQLKSLPATVRGQMTPPFVFDLSVSGTVWGEERSRSVGLVFCDTAGENLDDPALVEEWMPYLRLASGIIFLLDPLQIEDVQKRLPGGAAAQGQTSPPDQTIAAVRNLLPDGNTPTAITLAKCDVLRDIGLIEPNRLWNMSDRHFQAFNRELHDDMAGMMRELVMETAPNVHQTAVNAFPHHAFFGVSATGSADKLGQYPYVVPWRVEDPLLWLLSELEVIPTRD